MRTSIARHEHAGLRTLPANLATAWFKRGVGQLVRHLSAGRLTLVDDSGERRVYGTETDLQATLLVRSPRFYRAALLGGTVGIARSYMRGEWDCDDLVALFRMFARDRATFDKLEGGLSTARTLVQRASHRLRNNTRVGSKKNISAHYDMGNEFFASFLDRTMTYSSGIFERKDSTLEEASLAKIDRLCDKLRLGPHDHLVEVGTGWGGLAIRAAQRTGCRVTTTTLSKEQAAFARDRVEAAGLQDRIDVLERDYRDLTGQYDKLVSVEMIEAVGHRHLPTYFATCARLLKPDGVMAIQAITVRDQRYDIARQQVDVIQAILFPGSDTPSITAMLDAATKGSDLNLIDLEDITPHYARTLHLWRERFRANIDRVRELGADDAFLRLWDYYLSYCEAGFSERYSGCVQMVMAKPDARPDALFDKQFAKR